MVETCGVSDELGGRTFAGGVRRVRLSSVLVQGLAENVEQIVQVVDKV